MVSPTPELTNSVGSTEESCDRSEEPATRNSALRVSKVASSKVSPQLGRLAPQLAVAAWRSRERSATERFSDQRVTMGPCVNGR
jgi:hypothetical protein